MRVGFLFLSSVVVVVLVVVLLLLSCVSTGSGAVADLSGMLGLLGADVAGDGVGDSMTREMSSASFFLKAVAMRFAFAFAAFSSLSISCVVCATTWALECTSTVV